MRREFRFLRPDVKPQTKREKAEYIGKHFRYDTMHSWNLSSAPAHNIKVHKIADKWNEAVRRWPKNAGLCPLPIDHDLETKLYDFLDNEEAREEIDIEIENFTAEQGNQFTMGTNGHSGGYMVLYHSSYGNSGSGPHRLSIWPGRPVFEEYYQAFHKDSTEEDIKAFLKEEVSADRVDIDFEVVWSFDEYVEWACRNYIEYCREHKLIEREVTVKKKVLVSVGVESDKTDREMEDDDD